MNRLTAFGLVTLVAYGLLIGSKYTGFVSATRDDRPVAAAHGPAAIPAFPVAVPQAPVPSPHAAKMPAPVQRAQPARISPVALEFRNARDLKAYADTLLLRRGSLTADENYYLAKALEECQFATTINEDLAAYSAKQKKEFLARLPVDDPKNAQRIAAYDAVDSSQRCLKFQGSKIAAKDIEDLYRAAAMQGDARAQGRMLVAELNKNLTTNRVADVPASSVDDFSRITSLLESKDPEAILIVGQFLAQSALTNQLRIGPTGESPEPSAFLGAFSLVACDFGPDCVQLKPELQLACAHAAYCNAQTFDELYQNFMASPWVYVNAMRYRTIIRNAINTRDWSLIGLSPKSIQMMRDKLAELDQLDEQD
jgi:hypothetical protein